MSLKRSQLPPGATQADHRAIMAYCAENGIRTPNDARRYAADLHRSNVRMVRRWNVFFVVLALAFASAQALFLSSI